MVRSVEAPTLVLAGDRDRLVAVRSIRETCERNPRFVFRLWRNVGHVPQLDVPERVLPEIEELFALRPIKAGAAA